MSPLFTAILTIVLIIVIFIAIIIGVKNLQSMRDDQEDTGKRHHRSHKNIGGEIQLHGLLKIFHLIKIKI
jgi:hypothetical protein